MACCFSVIRFERMLYFSAGLKKHLVDLNVVLSKHSRTTTATDALRLSRRMIINSTTRLV